MKPGVDFAYAGFLPQASDVANTLSATSGEVSTPLITSTSFMRVAGLKKCMPTTRSGMRQAGGDRGDGQRRRVGRQDAIGPDDPFELRQQRTLDVDVFDDRLDHQAAGRKVHQLRRLDTRGHGARRFGVHLAALRERLQRLGHGPERALDRACLGVGQQYTMSGLRGHLRNAGAHRAGADDADHGLTGKGLRHR